MGLLVRSSAAAAAAGWTVLAGFFLAGSDLTVLALVVLALEVPALTVPALAVLILAVAILAVPTFGALALAVVALVLVAAFLAFGSPATSVAVAGETIRISGLALGWVAAGLMGNGNWETGTGADGGTKPGGGPVRLSTS
jgi:hypothetical protein